MNLKTLLIAVVAIISLSFEAYSQPLMQKFTQELKAKNEHVSTIQSDFSQTRSMAVLANDVVKRGVFYFSRPSNMLLSFSDGDFIKMTEAWFEMKSAGSLNKTKVSSNPMLKSLNSILSACMVGNFDEMSRGFDINVTESNAEWIVVMTPQRGKAVVKVSKIELRFDKTNMSLNSMNMVEKSGDYTLYTFSNKQFNKTIDTKLFNIS